MLSNDLATERTKPTDSRLWLAVGLCLALAVLPGCKKPQVEQENGPPLPSQSGPGGPPAGPGPTSGPGGPSGPTGPANAPGQPATTTAPATPLPEGVVPKKKEMTLEDACALFDGYLEQLGINLEGRSCDNHFVGDGWVRVNGYNIRDMRPSARGKNRLMPLNACLWKLEGENMWTVGYVDDNQGECQLADTYCKRGANRVIEHLSFGCPGDESHEKPAEKELEKALRGTWSGKGAVRRILFEPKHRITVVHEEGTVKGRWILAGANSIDIKADDGTMPRFNFMLAGDTLYFGSGPATWSRTEEEFVIRLDHNRFVRRLDNACWLILERAADKAIELDCPIKPLKSGAIVEIALPSGERYTLKRLDRDNDSGMWLSAVMLDGKLRRSKATQKK